LTKWEITRQKLHLNLVYQIGMSIFTAFNVNNTDTSLHTYQVTVDADPRADHPARSEIPAKPRRRTWRKKSSSHPDCDPSIFTERYDRPCRTTSAEAGDAFRQQEG
jgi:hypothetical protein